MPVEVETQDLARRPFRLGDWLVEPSLNRLSRGGTTTQLELKVMDVLVCLAERAGEVVPRQEIVDRVWATEFISDNTLTHAITEIRTALGDDARNPSFIETIHRRGYRLIAPVEPVLSDEPAESRVARFPVPEGREIAHEQRSPYPGLAAFTEADAEFFFGREEEVAQMWRKLTSRKLLAVIGPSGVGKSSFLRAGVIPAKPGGWGVLVCQPGEAPFADLARALVPEFEGDRDSISKLVHLNESGETVVMISRWRQQLEQALLIVDQFEELLTLNPREVQASFADLLRRAVDEADVHVLLSMRDDFLYRCHDHETLAPIFEDLTPVKAPSADALHQALVEPARRLGFAFEDDGLPKEMVSEVEGERGALPMLAFAVARLWEQRDRERKLLTRGAYGDLGGVGGALGQHAESTLRGIGEERLPIVRELFRNLVTAEGTRAVCEWGEMLSVFAEDRRSDAEYVMRRLIDARLLTSFEEEAVEGGDRRRVEVVHETLLTSWPRLVRWQTQDADAAQLRDQLRQAARTWEEHGRTDDMLWTGSAYREFALWREAYPGGLSELEDAFASAMTSLATRRRRRRRIAAAVAVVVTLVVAAVMGVLWRRSVLETRRAEAEAAQREAAQLLALGQLRLNENPNAALAYAIASLETGDNRGARHFAVEALWRGSSALYYRGPNPWSAGWSPDGRWLAVGGSERVELLQRGEKGSRQIRPGFDSIVGFTSDSRHLVTRPMGQPPIYRVWRLPEAQLEHTLTFEPRTYSYILDRDLFTITADDPEPGRRRSIPAELRSLDGSVLQDLGVWRPQGRFRIALDPTGTRLYSLEEGRIIEHDIEGLSEAGNLIGTHENAVDIWARPWRGRVVTLDSGGEVRIWDTTERRLLRTLKSTADAELVALGPSGRYLATSATWQGSACSLFLFDLTAPAGSEPTPLLGELADARLELKFSPDGHWLTTVHNGLITFWNVGLARTRVLYGGSDLTGSLSFTPAGELLMAADDGTLRKQSLLPTAAREAEIVWSQPGTATGSDLLVSGDGRRAFVAQRFSGIIFAVPLDGSPVSTYELKRSPGESIWGGIGMALDPSERFVAVPVDHPGDSSKNELRILDTVTGSERSLDTQPIDGQGCAEPGSVVQGMAVPVWLQDGRLISDGDAGLLLWDLQSGERQLLRPCREYHPSGYLGVQRIPDSQRILRLDGAFKDDEVSTLSTFDLTTGETREITSFENRVYSCAVDATGMILVTGDSDGPVRVGNILGGEPHLLLGHEGRVRDVTVSPDGATVVSVGEGGTVRLWPMPDLSKPPLHILPHDELIAKLKTLTNLRVVRDEESSTGWKVEVGPFPGWETVPTW